MFNDVGVAERFKALDLRSNSDLQSVGLWSLGIPGTYAQDINIHIYTTTSNVNVVNTTICLYASNGVVEALLSSLYQSGWVRESGP